MADGNYDTLRLSMDDRIARLTLAHPPVNILDDQMVADLADVCSVLQTASDVRVLIVDSDLDDFFIAHADISVRTERLAVNGFTPPTPRTRPNRFQALFARFRALPMATMAIIEGVARGGGAEFALAMDMRFAAIGAARIGLPEVVLGVCPGYGGTQLLPRLIGRSRALEMLLTGDDWDAELAERYGVVNRAIAPEAIRAFTEQVATRIASLPAGGLRAAKASLLASEAPLEPGFLVEHEQSLAAAADPEVLHRLETALAMGAQTPSFELTFPARYADLAPPPEVIGPR